MTSKGYHSPSIFDSPCSFSFIAFRIFPETALCGGRLDCLLLVATPITFLSVLKDIPHHCRKPVCCYHGPIHFKVIPTESYLGATLRKCQGHTGQRLCKVTSNRPSALESTRRGVRIYLVTGSNFLVTISESPFHGNLVG